MMSKDGKARPDFRVMGQDASFTNNEFLNIKGVDVEHILDHIFNYPSVKGIVNNVSAVKSAIGSLGQAAGQKRRAGRCCSQQMPWGMSTVCATRMLAVNTILATQVLRISIFLPVFAAVQVPAPSSMSLPKPARLFRKPSFQYMP